MSRIDAHTSIQGELRAVRMGLTHARTPALAAAVELHRQGLAGEAAEIRQLLGRLDQLRERIAEKIEHLDAGGVR